MATGIFQEWVLRFGVDNKKALSSLNNMEKSFNRLKKIILTVVGSKMVKEMANFGKEVGLMADRTGISVSKLTALRSAFNSAGGSAKGFNNAINRINQGLLGLNKGDGSLAAALAPMGISPFGKTAEQIIMQSADWAKGRVNAGMDKRMVMDYLMSSLGVDEASARAMLQGSGYLRAEQERAKSEGRILSDEDANRLTYISNKIQEFFDTLYYGGVKVVSALQPLFEGISETFTGVGIDLEAIVFAIKEYEPELRSIGRVLGLVVRGIIDIVGGLVVALGAVVRAFESAYDWFSKAGYGLAYIFDSLIQFIKEKVNSFKRFFGFGDDTEILEPKDEREANLIMSGLPKSEIKRAIEEGGEVLFPDPQLAEAYSYENKTTNIDVYVDRPQYNNVENGEQAGNAIAENIATRLIGVGA